MILAEEVYQYFIVCRTCKIARWWNHEMIQLFIEGHEGHLLTIMTPHTFDEQEAFREWFLKFMDWPEEAEGFGRSKPYDPTFEGTLKPEEGEGQ